MIGKIVNEEKQIAFVGLLGQGFGFKDKQAFKNKTGICYIPEFAFLDDDATPHECSDCKEGEMYFDTYFTYNDFFKLAEKIKKETNTAEKYTTEKIAETIFQMVDWQFPSTLVDEWIADGEMFED